MASPDGLAGQTDACPHCGRANAVPPLQGSGTKPGSAEPELQFASPEEFAAAAAGADTGVAPPDAGAAAVDVILTPVGQAPPAQVPLAQLAAPAAPGAPGRFFTLPRIIAGSAAVLILLASALPWVWTPESTLVGKMAKAAESVAKALGGGPKKPSPLTYSVTPYRLINVAVALMLGGALFLPKKLWRAAAWWCVACVGMLVAVYLIWDHGVQMQVWGRPGLGVQVGLFVALAGYVGACAAAGWEAARERKFWFTAPIAPVVVVGVAVVLFTSIFGMKSYRVVLKEGDSNVRSAWGSGPTATVSISAENTGWNTLRLAAFERIPASESDVVAIKMYQEVRGDWQQRDASKLVSITPQTNAPGMFSWSDLKDLAERKAPAFPTMSVPPRTIGTLRLSFRPAWAPGPHVTQTLGGRWALELHRAHSDAQIGRIEFDVPSQRHPATDFLVKLESVRALHRPGRLAEAWKAVNELKPPPSVPASTRRQMESLRGEIWRAWMGQILARAEAAWASLRGGKPTASQAQGVLDLLKEADPLVRSPEAGKADNRTLSQRLTSLKKEIDAGLEGQRTVSQIEALIRSGQVAEAKRRLSRFKSRFPLQTAAADRLAALLGEVDKKATEEARKAQIAKIESLVKGEQLAEAEAELKRFEGMYASDTQNIRRLTKLVQDLAAAVKRRNRAGRVAKIDSLLKGGRLTEAAPELTRFEADYPEDKELVGAYRTRLLALGRTEATKLLDANEYAKAVRLIEALASQDRRRTHSGEFSQQAFQCAVCLMALKEPREQVRQAENLARRLNPQITADKRWPEVRAYIEGVAPEPVWPVAGWTDVGKSTLPAKHPMRACCDVLKEIRSGQVKALAGVNFGPRAKSRTDPPYAQFKDKHFKAFEAALAAGGSKRKPAWTTQKMGGLTCERVLALKVKQAVTVAITIKDGYCVAYWFRGHYDCFSAFADALPLAKLGYPRRPGPPRAR